MSLGHFRCPTCAFTGLSAAAAVRHSLCYRVSGSCEFRTDHEFWQGLMRSWFWSDTTVTIIYSSTYDLLPWLVCTVRKPVLRASRTLHPGSTLRSTFRGDFLCTGASLSTVGASLRDPRSHGGFGRRPGVIDEQLLWRTVVGTCTQACSS